jgi:hypothetical protein
MISGEERTIVSDDIHPFRYKYASPLLVKDRVEVKASLEDASAVVGTLTKKTLFMVVNPDLCKSRGKDEPTSGSMTKCYVIVGDQFEGWVPADVFENGQWTYTQ